MSRSWGSGTSTSDAEKKAAAMTGSTVADLPVNFSLPADIHAAWMSSATRPGVSLVGADLRPTTMVENVRAAIFPHLQQQVQATVALSMTRQAWGDVETFERMHAWRCGDEKPKLRMVVAIEDAAHETRTVAATTSPTGKNTAAQAAAVSSQQAAKAPPITGTEGRPRVTLVSPRRQLSQLIANGPEKRFLSSERWVVQRCDGELVYRVQYFGLGDHFYAQVAPTNLASFATIAFNRVKRLFAPPS